MPLRKPATYQSTPYEDIPAYETNILGCSFLVRQDFQATGAYVGTIWLSTSLTQIRCVTHLSIVVSCRPVLSVSEKPIY